MSAASTSPPDQLSAKIARLVEERGWNQEDFARITKLNRHTVRQILLGQGRKPHNATVQSCAKALGVSVNELRSLPITRLLARVRGEPAPDGEDNLRRLYVEVSQPELHAWLDRNPDRARNLNSAEVDEIVAVSLEGALSRLGVERYVEMLERRRELLDRVKLIAGTEYLELLEKFVELLYDKVRA